MLRTILAGFLAGTVTSLAFSQQPRSTTLHSVAVAKLCLPTMDAASANAFLDKLKIRTPGARLSERTAVARGLNAIWQSSGQSMLVRNVLQGSEYRFRDKTGKSRERGTHIEINRNHCLSKPEGGKICHNHPPDYDNVAFLVHEMGHKFGNSGWYAEYQRRDKSVDQSSGHRECLVSRYASDSFRLSKGKINEPFAEAFAAFLTNPKLLAETPGCASAMAFFQKKFPANQANRSDCLSNPGNRAIAESFDETHGYRDEKDQTPATNSTNQDLGQILPLLFGIAPMLFPQQQPANPAQPVAQDAPKPDPPQLAPPPTAGGSVTPPGTQ